MTSYQARSACPGHRMGLLATLLLLGAGGAPATPPRVIEADVCVYGGTSGAPPYPIGYGAIVPKAAECDNLFVTFALSARHTAFASIRMEPVFMVTSQSAATAASLAIDAGVAVQQVNYETLEARLLADGQVLKWPPK